MTITITLFNDSSFIGNTIVLKPSEMSMNTSNLLKKMLDATFDKVNFWAYDTRV